MVVTLKVYDQTGRSVLKITTICVRLNVFAGECVGNVFNYFVFWIIYLHIY